MRGSILIAAIFGAALACAAPALAQVPGAPAGQPVPGAMTPDTARGAANDRAMESERLSRTPTRSRRGERAATLTAGQAAVRTAALACEVTDAAHPGRAGDADVYEVACADAPGWLLLVGGTVETFNCLALEKTAGPGGDGSTQCDLPANKDAPRAMAGYVRTLGLSCDVAQAEWIGRLPDAADRYELRCRSGDGYWIESDRQGRPLNARTCSEVQTAGGDCRFRP